MKNKIEKLIICMISIAFITSFSINPLSMHGFNTGIDDFSDSISNLSTQDVFWPPNSSDWTEVAPESQGLDSDKISKMFENIEILSYDIHSVIIVRNGYLLTEEYLYNSQLLENKSYFGGETLHMQMSTTKSLMSILIGIALQEGFLNNLNQTLYEFFGNIWEPSFRDSELKKNITIEQLLTHNSGLGESPSYLLLEIDCIKYALDLISLEFTPGEAGEFSYSNDGVNLLSGIISNVTGKTTEEFAQEYLFTPLGISEDEYYWWRDNQGMRYGAYGFDCTPKVQAKLGILCLNNGTWNGTQILDEEYLKEATTPKIDWGWGYGYGYLFNTMLIPYEGYYAYGAGGQCIYVLPEYNITVGFTADSDNVPYETLLSQYIIQFAKNNAPEWDQRPKDQLIHVGDSFLYDVNASDASGVAYLINDTVNFNINPEGIITNTSSLSLGVYPLEITAYNTFNNSITATIQIRVDPKPISNGIPGFDFNMILIMILCTSAVLISRRKRHSKN
ncbi:MAG: serine hydrolase domain-containing protein [Promethearchaeota archaeon]|jgi:CubicO group peptidase (beta-lactamase class C family)